jgi:hypothetical protein
MMIRERLFILRLPACFVFITALILLVPGCAQATSSDSSSSSSTSGTGSWSYTASDPVFIVSSGVTTVTITPAASGTLSGKTIYLVNTNPSASVASSLRILSSSSGMTSATASSSRSAVASAVTGSLPEPDSAVTAAAIKNFVPPQTFVTLSAVSAARSALTSASASVTQITAVVGTTTKSVYVDTDSTLSAYSQKTATLRAEGTYCYVWVVDSYYTTDSSLTSADISSALVNTAVAKAFAEKFDAMYPMIRSVFGGESDKIYSYSSGSWSLENMSTLSDTGTKVNIVLYDIGNDTNTGDVGVLGYFYAKDYYENVNGVSGFTSSDARYYSNEGKYFYVDSYYAGDSDYQETTYSTLAHEFQHMIDFNAKNITYGLSPSTWYNEMLSMLCEDLMQSYLGISDSSSPKGRLPTFCQYYPYVGLEYREDSSSYEVISYATAYAFGCWLCRQFGGAALVQKLSANSSVDYTSVVKAVNTVNGTSYTMEDLLKLYAEACVFTTTDTSYTYPTFNQAASQTLSYTGSDTIYAYPMTAVNLWGTAYEYLVTSNLSYYCNATNGTGTGGTYCLGPAVFASGVTPTSGIRPYGMFLQELGTVNSGESVTLTLSSSSSSSAQSQSSSSAGTDTYLFIQ